MTNKVMLVTGTMLLVAFVPGSSLIAKRMGQLSHIVSANPPIINFFFVTVLKAAVFEGVAIASSMILVVPLFVLTSSHHSIGNYATYIVIALAVLALDYRLYRRGSVFRRDEIILIHRFLWNERLPVAEVLSVEPILVGSLFPRTKIGLRMGSGELKPVPGLTFLWSVANDLRGDATIVSVVRYLSLLSGLRE